MFHAPIGRFQLELIYYFTYFLPSVPSNTCVFLSCRPLVVNTTFSTGLEVSFVSWLEQLTVRVQITDYCNLLDFKILFVAWSGLFYLGVQITLRGEDCILGHSVLRWHHWASFCRRLLLEFQWFKLQLSTAQARKNR